MIEAPEWHCPTKFTLFVSVSEGIWAVTACDENGGFIVEEGEIHDCAMAIVSWTKAGAFCPGLPDAMEAIVEKVTK